MTGSERGNNVVDGLKRRGRGAWGVGSAEPGAVGSGRVGPGRCRGDGRPVGHPSQLVQRLWVRVRRKHHHHRVRLRPVLGRTVGAHEQLGLRGGVRCVHQPERDAPGTATSDNTNGTFTTAAVTPTTSTAITVSQFSHDPESSGPSGFNATDTYFDIQLNPSTTPAPTSWWSRSATSVAATSSTGGPAAYGSRSRRHRSRPPAAA